MVQNFRGIAAAAILSGTLFLQRAFQLAPPKPQLSARAEALKKDILKVLEQNVGTEYALGLLFGSLLEDEAYYPYPSALAWWDDQVPGDVASRTAERYYRVSRFFGLAQFRQFGVVRLELVIVWCSMKGIEVPKDPSQVQITWIADGKEVTAPFSDCTYDDMLAAVHPHHALPQPGSKPRKLDKRLPEWTKKFVSLVQNRLHEHMNGDLGKVQFVVKGTRKAPSYSLLNVSESELFEVLDILSKTAAELGTPPPPKGGRHAGSDHP
jgi:hypothetical protein